MFSLALFPIPSGRQTYPQEYWRPMMLLSRTCWDWCSLRKAASLSFLVETVYFWRIAMFCSRIVSINYFEQWSTWLLLQINYKLDSLILSLTCPFGLDVAYASFAAAVLGLVAANRLLDCLYSGSYLLTRASNYASVLDWVAVES